MANSVLAQSDKHMLVSDHDLEMWRAEEPVSRVDKNALLLDLFGLGESDLSVIENADVTKVDMEWMSRDSGETNVAGRPTEDVALNNVQAWMDADGSWSKAPEVTGKQWFEVDVQAWKARKRSEYVKQLDAAHRDWLEQIKRDLLLVRSMVELYCLVDTCVAHDARLAALAGREFCDSYAAIANDFARAESRIRSKVSPKAVTVHYQSVPEAVVQAAMVERYPIIMKKGVGGKLLAFTVRDVNHYVQEGWTICVGG